MNNELYKQHEQLRVKAGTPIFHENDFSDSMYVVQQGRVQISKSVMAGVEKTLTILEEGEYFGEMSLLLNSPRSATAVALDDSVLIKLGREEFKQLLQASPEAGIAMLTQLAGRLEKSTREAILIALEMALLEQRPPSSAAVRSSSPQFIAAGSFDLANLPAILECSKTLHWDAQTQVVAQLLKPGESKDALVYVLQLQDYRELLKLTACFGALVEWKISVAVDPADARLKESEQDLHD
ncbi:transcriptional regulatory protein [Candidatus Moduliflexus flocculans]|uniref:Transcriptional regulatory protein n=1 Tax=Candidatus Moduliflexus flocculans TaxID=1499966 RepID=A0A081BQ18_9BACT|nr:transcriptional regulatory protein [Candidatus Moduliflexus flocculans]